jgi:hypothetical protein
MSREICADQLNKIDAGCLFLREDLEGETISKKRSRALRLKSWSPRDLSLS